MAAQAVITVSTSVFESRLPIDQELARTEGVMALEDGRESTVLISAAEYRRLERRDREVLGLVDFTAKDIAEIAASLPPHTSKAFDDEPTP